MSESKKKLSCEKCARDAVWRPTCVGCWEPSFKCRCGVKVVGPNGQSSATSGVQDAAVPGVEV